eukprot:CAMPEP_0183498472 /NCGR_PEP_ID=MMETSP0371-20130417/827_1 /TAXON_ID=268820 /ORGANISM="Peridinium aciculiferum, Strain PAER-2" /LENGTH=101 /DNA_ID=CAMNT_0025692009 /DNA_START=29 /DNA_END=330 /DNA_ORIENTATION=-
MADLKLDCHQDCFNSVVLETLTYHMAVAKRPEEANAFRTDTCKDTSMQAALKKDNRGDEAIIAFDPKMHRLGQTRIRKGVHTDLKNHPECSASYPPRGPQV